MKGPMFWLVGLLVFQTSSAEVIFQDDFETGLSKWRQLAREPEGRLGKPGRSGSALEFDLKADPSVRNSNRWINALESRLFPARKGSYRMTGKIRFLKNFGVGIHVRFYNAARKQIGSMGTHYGSKPASTETWFDIDFSGSSYQDETAYFSVGFNFPAWVDMTIRVDDLKLEYQKPAPRPPLWKPAYKISPEETGRLTAADFPAPDGIVYPDFSRAGVQLQKHSAEPAKVVYITPDCGDLHAAITRAIESFGPEGGVVKLAPGDYTLNRFLYITRDNVVLKGAGREKTRILFNYDVPEAGVELYGIREGDVFGPDTSILVIARPAGLQQIRLLANGREVRKVVRGMHSGNDSFLVGSLKTLKKNTAAGPLKLRAEAQYSNGKKAVSEIAVRFDPASRKRVFAERPQGAITIRGKGPRERRMLLAETAPRGVTEVRLQRADHGLKAGDAIVINAPATAEWKKLTRNACTWGTWRNYIVFLRDVKGTRLYLDQPLRIEYPIDSAPFVDKIELIQRCGVEDLRFEHKNDYWVDSIHFLNAANCHASGLWVYKTGRNPVYGDNMKFSTIRDCVLDDSWFKGGGGTAYVGFDHSYDNLMENVETRRMRHAPCVQWSAAGNVVRNSVFHGSDAQWHSGWSNENLFENCIVVSDTKVNGGYGYGAWASAPEDGSHGPNGPRNVMYNCDVFSEKDAIWLGGMNENWIFVGNRFRVQKGAGIFVKDNSFDHIIRDNVFILESPAAPALILASADCGGTEFCNNTVYGGNGRGGVGLRKPEKESGNRFLPLNRNAARPTLKLPSIYEYQLRQRQRQQPQN